MNLPNKLTITRIILTVIFLFFISQNGLVATIIAALTFILAALTDFYDGYIAKKYNLISDFGKLMDPIADKFLILAAFIAFVRMQIVADWMVILIFGREVLITSLRLFAISKGKVLAAEKGGKQKTVSQIVVILTVLAFTIFRECGINQPWSFKLEAFWRCGIDVLMLITVALTLVSGLSYLWNNRRLVRVE